MLWFVTNCALPRALRRVNEPLGSRDAAYTPQEAARLAEQSRLSGWQITAGPLWLIVEGTNPMDLDLIEHLCYHVIVFVFAPQ